MRFIETELSGAYLVELEPIEDERGFFCRSFCSDQFKQKGLTNVMVQSNISWSKYKHTLRGMHYQFNGNEEVKLIRCTRGRLLDTIIDLRPDSKTYCKHFSVELSADKNFLLYVPKQFAHGFITLENYTEIFYQVSAHYSKNYESGIRWDDPLFNIDWGTNSPIVSDRDNSHLDFDPNSNPFTNGA